MASRTDESRRPTQRIVPALVVAGAALVLIVLAIAFWGGGDSTPEITDGEVSERPPGAGTRPDGAIDETTEGLQNETATEDFLDQTEATNTEPALMERGDGPPAATSVEELDVPAPADLPDGVDGGDGQTGQAATQ